MTATPTRTRATRPPAVSNSVGAWHDRRRAQRRDADEVGIAADVSGVVITDVTKDSPLPNAASSPAR